MVDRATHWINVGTTTNKAGFVTSDVYSEVGTVLGVSKLAAGDTDIQMTDVSDLIRYGKAMRLRVRYRAGTETKSSTVLCDIDKAATAVAELRGKSFRGGTILSANIMRRRRRG